MTLREYLIAEKLSLAGFGRMVGVAHSTVLRWRDGLIFPSRENLGAIRRVTGGRVTANDFMVVTSSGPTAAPRRPPVATAA